MNIKIAFFSGTGTTQFVAETIKREIEARNHSATLVKINNLTKLDSKDCHILIICYPVHACNAPKPVLNWINKGNESDNTPTVVFSVSGGGEITPNLASRYLAKKALGRKNYSVFYEKMIIMPSNWIIPTKPKLIQKLLEVLPYKISYYVNDVLNGKTSLYNPGIGNLLISWMGRLEQYGAVQFGKRIKVKETCNGCGICMKGCPVNNIEIQNNRPVILNKCSLCLQCLYGCPQGALIPGIAKFILIKEGFDFSKILEHRDTSLSVDIKQETKGLLWLGLRRYLLDNNESLTPEGKLTN